MAHGTLIGGTAYGITGGKALIGGTAYGISKGRTMIDGTGYDISFGPQPAKTRVLLSDATCAPMTAMTFAEGNWIVVASKYNSTLYLMWGAAPGGDWSTKTLPFKWYHVTSIIYANGYYVMTLSYPGSGAFYENVASIYYATSLNGPWTEAVLGEASADSYERCAAKTIAYGGGYWVVGGLNEGAGATYDGGIWYATDLAGPWTYKPLTACNEVNAVTYANGYWAIGGDIFYRSTGGKPYKKRILYAKSPDKDFASSIVWEYAAMYDSKINCIAYADGYWVAGGYAENSSRYTVAQIAYATSLSGTWTVKQLWGTEEASGSSEHQYNAVHHINRTNGLWTFCGDYHNSTNSNVYVAYAENLTDTPTILLAWSGDNENHTPENGIFCNYANDYWVVGGWRYGSTSTPKSTTQLVYGKSLECFERA